MGLRRAARLSTRERIAAVRRSGRRGAGPCGSLWALPSETGASRLAVAVPKRLGTAVARNRLRRRMQAQFSAMSAGWVRPWDMFFLAREAAMSRSYGELGSSLSALLQQADVR